MAGVQRLHEVEGLAAADLAEDEPVGPHPQGVADEVAHRHQTDLLGRRRPGLQPNDVGMEKSELGRVLGRHDPLGGVDLGGDRIQQGGLARTGAAADDQVGVVGDRGRQHPGSVTAEVVQLDALEHEPADGDVGPVERDRRNDDVDPAAVGEPAIDAR